MPGQVAATSRSYDFGKALALQVIRAAVFGSGVYNLSLSSEMRLPGGEKICAREI